ncbi:hypothetical protein D9756_000044 [Leucocoprinus leucothites]|uniref:Uncharacterized protein n=1 Tax=Leucocoprinus leucothites TaxID=201217 RepID=A0A8H5GF71_9AGAR|nr:hypothetical protein D9756_000044 [Leucoagaricus leucothites]
MPKHRAKAHQWSCIHPSHHNIKSIPEPKVRVIRTVRSHDVNEGVGLGTSDSSTHLGVQPVCKEERGKEMEEEGNVSSTRHKEGKRSVGGGKSGRERLSIFGGTFSGSLTGKGKKPPPIAGYLEVIREKSSMSSLPQLESGSIRKSSSTSNQPSTFNSNRRNITHQQRERASTLLRKIPTSSSVNGNENSAATAAMAGAAGDGVGFGGATGLIKPGQSILDQIGQPDHMGWMRKRGDRYNSCKNWYFVLKGQHMYCLRSGSKLFFFTSTS